MEQKDSLFLLIILVQYHASNLNITHPQNNMVGIWTTTEDGNLQYHVHTTGSVEHKYQAGY